MVAEAITGHEFIDGLLQQTPPAASQPRRGQNYNYPKRLFLKPDGSVVALQGDPQNRAYYQDKGYRLLSEAPARGGGKSEVRQYLEDAYPQILAEQRQKAAIINAIRKAGERYKDLSLEDTFDDYTVGELREYLAQIKEETGKDIRVIMPRRQQAAQEAADARLLAGVETSDTASIEGLQSKLERGREATFQGTGYDPIEQSRRSRARGTTP